MKSNLSVGPPHDLDLAIVRRDELAPSPTSCASTWTRRFCSSAQRAVISEPLSSAASTTTVPSAKPLISRFRRGKWNARGGVPQANSVTSAPCGTISAARSAWQEGYTRSIPVPSTATAVTEGRRAGRRRSARIPALSFTARPYGRNQRGARQLLEKIYATCGEVGERDSISRNRSRPRRALVQAVHAARREILQGGDLGEPAKRERPHRRGDRPGRHLSSRDGADGAHREAELASARRGRRGR